MKGKLVRCGPSNKLHFVPKVFQIFLSLIQDDHAVARIAARPPEPEGAVAADRRGQSLALVEEIDGSGFRIELAEDAAVLALGSRDAASGERSFVGDLLPSELIGVPLRQG